MMDKLYEEDFDWWMGSDKSDQYTLHVTEIGKNQILEHQDIVARLEETYQKFGKLTIDEMTISSWTPERMCSLLEYIHGNLTKEGDCP